MEEKICSVFGHRDVEITDGLRFATLEAINSTIADGCRTFYFGGYSDFDSLCHELVSKIREEKPELDIKRVYCVPLERFLRKRVRYFNREDYEDVIYLSPLFQGWYKSIYYRNCAIIDESTHVIFYAGEKAKSGAYKTYKYAKGKKDKTVINLYKE